jgi:hypothetical protein
VLVFCDTRDSAVFLDCWTRLFRTSKVIAFSHTIGSFCHEKLVDADRVESPCWSTHLPLPEEQLPANTRRENMSPGYGQAHRIVIRILISNQARWRHLIISAGPQATRKTVQPMCRSRQTDSAQPRCSAQHPKGPAAGGRHATLSVHRPDPQIPPTSVRDLDAAVPPRPPLRFLRWRGCTGWRLCCRWASSAACSASWATPSTTSTGPRTAGCAPILPLPILHARIPPRADSRFPPLSLWVQPKHIGNDMWDVAMERRDKKLVERPSGS